MFARGTALRRCFATQHWLRVSSLQINRASQNLKTDRTDRADKNTSKDLTNRWVLPKQRIVMSKTGAHPVIDKLFDYRDADIEKFLELYPFYELRKIWFDEMRDKQRKRFSDAHQKSNLYFVLKALC